MHQVFEVPTFLRAFLVLALGLSFSAVSFAQDDARPVDRSALAGVRLPKGALRLDDASVPAEVGQTMRKLVGGAEGKLRQGETEVLIWAGSDLKKAGSRAITERVASALSAEGWKYEVSGTENGITFFSVLRVDPERRGLLGFFGEADGALVFAWTEVHPVGQPATPSNSTVEVNGGSVSDYSFATPSGWRRSETANKITLTTPDGERSLVFLPPMDSSGDLERDADRILWQAFKGHEPWHGNGFEPDYGVFERGRTIQGLEYFRAYRYAQSRGSDGSYDSRSDLNILLVKLGGKVAVIAGRSPFQSDSHQDSAGTVMDLMLYDLKFKSVTSPYDLKRELLGSWSTASSTVGLAYTFNANGTFHKGGAISFRTSHDATRDKVTTTSYGMTDRYSLAGNVITQTYKTTGEVSKYKVRIYETKYDKDPWQQKLGFLSVAGPDGGTIVFTRSR